MMDFVNMFTKILILLLFVEHKLNLYKTSESVLILLIPSLISKTGFQHCICITFISIEHILRYLKAFGKWFCYVFKFLKCVFLNKLFNWPIKLCFVMSKRWTTVITTKPQLKNSIINIYIHLQTSQNDAQSPA